MSKEKEFLDILNMKKMNLIKIRDLLSTNNGDLYSLYKAKETQEYINARLASISFGNKKLKLIHLNTDFFPDTESETSKFVKFDSTIKQPQNTNISNRKIFDSFCVNVKNLDPIYSNTSLALKKVENKPKNYHENREIVPVDFHKVHKKEPCEEMIIQYPKIEEDDETLLFDKVILEEMKYLHQNEDSSEDFTYDDEC